MSFEAVVRIHNELFDIPVCKSESNGDDEEHLPNDGVRQYDSTGDFSVTPRKCSHCEGIGLFTAMLQVTRTAPRGFIMEWNSAQGGFTVRVGGGSRMFGPMCGECNSTFVGVIVELNESGRPQPGDLPVHYNPVRYLEATRALKPKRKGQRGGARAFCSTSSVKREYRRLAANRRFARRR